MKKYATFWERLVAILIDGIIIGGLSALLGKEGQLIGSLLGIVYIIGMNGTYGATIGKKVMGIKIIRESGSPITYADATIRYLASILSGLVLFIGYLWVLWDPKRQAWHDHIAKTIVVKA